MELVCHFGAQHRALVNLIPLGRLKGSICLPLQLTLPILLQVLLHILDRCLDVLSRAHAPRHHTILHHSLLELGSQVEGWFHNGAWLHLEILINLSQGHPRVMVHTQYIVNIKQNVCPILHAVIRTGLFLHLKVLVSKTGLPTQVVHAGFQVIPEGSSLGLEAIQRPDNEGSLTSVFTKFRTKHSPNFLFDWGSQISVLNIAHHNI
jgi:hypothetical protein